MHIRKNLNTVFIDEDLSYKIVKSRVLNDARVVVFT